MLAQTKRHPYGIPWILFAMVVMAMSCGSTTDSLSDPPQDDSTTLPDTSTAPPQPPNFLDPVNPTLRLDIDVPAIALRISDADHGVRMEREVTGWIREGNYAEEMVLRIPPNAEGDERVLCGGFERPGTYEIELRSPSYQTWGSTITVNPSEWGWPNTAELDVELEFLSVEGSWELFQEDRSWGIMNIYQTRSSIQIIYGGRNALIHTADGEFFHFSLPTLETNTFRLILVPPDLLTGTVFKISAIGARTTLPAMAIRTGPAPLR